MPGMCQGDRGLSHVPALPLWRHAPLSDPGGVLRTRLSAPRTGACRPLETVGFPCGTAEGSPRVHDATHVGAHSRGLHLRSLQRRTPITGCARGGHYRSAGEAFLGWDLSHLGSHPLGNRNQFPGLTPTPKVSGFPWRDQCLVPRQSQHQQAAQQEPDHECGEEYASPGVCLSLSHRVALLAGRSMAEAGAIYE
jgi:hypothetical protein